MAKADKFRVFTINIFWNYNKITKVVKKKHRYFSLNNPISSKLVLILLKLIKNCDNVFVQML